MKSSIRYSEEVRQRAVRMVMEHLRPVAEPLLPMYAFEAMADVLRPLATGLAGFDYDGDTFSLFVDESYDLSEEGERLLAELATRAADGARRLGDVEGTALRRVLPERCERQLADVREGVERVAWILWGASIASDVLSPPDRPARAAGLAYAMVRGAYRDLCESYAEYRDDEKAAVEERDQP